MASEEDLKVAAFIVNDWRHVYYAISERLKETPVAVADLAEAIATALTAARAEQREVDAKIADAIANLASEPAGASHVKSIAEKIAAAIRAGKE